LVSNLDHQTYTCEVHQHLDEKHLRAITLHRSAGLRRGMPVFDSGSSLQVPVSPDCLSRLLDLFGEPLDGGPPLGQQTYRNILAKPGPLHEAKAATDILETGIKVVDLLCPFIRGGKTGLLEDPESPRPF